MEFGKRIFGSFPSFSQEKNISPVEGLTKALDSGFRILKHGKT
jgi:hypothetical protein